MSVLDRLIQLARKQGASDIHLEPDMPVTLRIRGRLEMLGDRLSAKQLQALSRALIGQQHWPEFVSQCSFDMSRTIQGTRCRLNVFQTSRGTGMAIRLLSSFHADIEKLNLHPDLRSILDHPHGLVLVCGPTGSGKSTTIAAFLQEINMRESQHIITIEHPIEYALRPEKSLIRQREVGRDTPSFEQALLDALREDPDVLVVGEMRHPETMRLTLNAAETGHLVFSTLHSSSCAEALQRLVSAFPADTQANVQGQLADSLVAVVCQRLVYQEELDLRIPECEILMATTGVRSQIRQGHFSRLSNAIETGGEHGMWSRERYSRWLRHRQNWFIPQDEWLLPPQEEQAPERPALPSTPAPKQSTSLPSPTTMPKLAPAPKPKRARNQDGVLVLESEEDDLDAIVSALNKL